MFRRSFSKFYFDSFSLGRDELPDMYGMFAQLLYGVSNAGR